MPALVLDASLTCAWCFPDERTNYSQAVLEAVRSSSVDAVAQRLWAYEVRNSILVALRRKRITKSDSEEFLSSLNELNVHLREPGSYDDLFAIADQFGLTVYDAAYLNTGIEQRLPLASLDKQLIQAATAANVPIFQP